MALKKVNYVDHKTRIPASNLNDIQDAIIELEKKKAFVTPEMFGAVGDGVTDDTAALDMAFCYAAEHGVKCLVPSGVYVISPTKKAEGYNYCFEIKSGLVIEGANKEETVLKVATSVTSYLSIFSAPNSGQHVSNVLIKNITIEQDPYAYSDEIRGAGVRNAKYAVHATAICENLTLHNIHFKNCCGANTVILGNPLSHNITVSSCLFDYKLVEGVSWYDRSILYMNCHNYLVENNVIDGKFETLGGLELHGYNGTARNNLIKGCYSGINIALDYDTALNSAGTFVTENRFENNAKAVSIWGNYSAQNKDGNIDISICNNMIYADGAIMAEKFVNFDGTGAVNKRLSGIELNQGAETPYKALRIIGNSLVFKNTKKQSNFSSIISSGIGIWGVADVEGVTISHNYIEGCGGNGIKIGTTNESIVKAFKNIIVTENILKDCGRLADAQANYLAYILLSHGNKENIVINNNILEKTDTDINTWSAFYNHSSDAFTHQEVYFSKNIIRSQSKYEMKITNVGASNVIYDEGETTQRSTIAKEGHIFFDTTIKKLIMWNGSTWTNLDGTALETA